MTCVSVCLKAYKNSTAVLITSLLSCIVIAMPGAALLKFAILFSFDHS